MNSLDLANGADVSLKEILDRGVMFDSNIFDELLKNFDLLEKLPRDIKICITNIQYEEISKLTDVTKKNNLLRIVDPPVSG